jgi:uncharacterized membrane protein YkvI
MAEILLLLSIVAAPLAAGALATLLSRPWWWGAILAIAVFLIAALVPEPEEGESRLVAGDLVFLLVVALVIAGLTWLGAWATRRVRAARA